MVDRRLAHAGAARREQDVRALLPYARHATDTVVALDTQALMVCFQLDGASFETADVRDLNDWHAKLNGAWRNLADDRLAIWHHLVRRPQALPAPGRFQSAFARDLDARYRERLGGRRLFVNDLFVTLVLHPGLAASDRAGRLVAKGAADIASEDQAIARLEDAARDLQQYLARYGVRPLGLIEQDGRWTSEPLALVHTLLTGEVTPVPLVRGHLGSAAYDARLIFGREALEIRDVCATRYAAMFGIKEYPATTRPGVWNALLSAPFPLVVSQSFTFLSRPSARAVMERKQNQMISARDRAASQVSELGEALDDLVSNRFVMGDHQASVLVLGDTPAALQDNLSRTRALLAESGLVAVREDLALESAFWAQFPGAFVHRVRPAAITSRNFAAFAPFHTYPAGRATGNHWGNAVALLRTAAGSPFHFNFHVGDLGHTFICGPSGSGKTVVQNFMLAQLEALSPQRIFIDKDRGAEIFVRASGGRYLTLRNGEPTGFAPFKALSYDAGDRAFLGQLVRTLIGAPTVPLSPQENRAVDLAIAALAPMPPAQRSLAALRALLGQRDAGGVGARLQTWCRGEALGWVLDNDTDEIELTAALIGFDMTHMLDNAQVRTPTMLYLFHRILGRVDGRRLVIDIDEFWKALDDEAFRGLAQDGLKTFRKQNAMMVFGTQSPADVLRSPISHTVVEQCATKIFLPNPHAAERDYIEGFGLTRREYALVREDLDPSRRQFLIKQGLDSVVAELRLDGMHDALAILSGRAETVDLLDRLRARLGDDPADWIGPFHQERSVLP